MKVNDILYCYNACPCVMGWEECDSDEIGDEIVNDTHKPNCANGENK